MTSFASSSELTSLFDNPIVVSGPPRSGTTMFMAYLDGHDDCFWLPDEGFFFEHLLQMGEGWQHLLIDAATSNIEACIEGIRDRSVMPTLNKPIVDFPSLELGWNEERFRATLNLDDVTDVKTLWARLVLAYRAGLNAKGGIRPIVKAADFGRSVIGALRFFPRANGIIVVRDPLRMLNSLKRYREIGGHKLLTWPTLMQTIREMNELAQYVASLSSEQARRLMVVRYEDLVADPERVMRNVCDMIGLSWHQCLLQPSMLNQSWTANSSFTVNSGIDAVPTERPETLKVWEKDLANKYLDPFRQVFGYT